MLFTTKMTTKPPSNGSETFRKIPFPLCMFGVKSKENSFIKKTNFPNFRFVDMYTLNTHNLSTKYMNATFHHSRLMGASDIYNSVSFFAPKYFFSFCKYFCVESTGGGKQSETRKGSLNCQ